MGNKTWSKSSKLVTFLFASTTLFIIVVNIFKAHFLRVLHCYFPLDTLISNPTMILLGILTVLGLFFVTKMLIIVIKKLNFIVLEKNTERNILLITGVVFFFFQIYFVYNYCFETDWDVQILLDSARHIAAGQRPNHNFWYYSNCPNNIFLTAIFSIILWISKPLHLGQFDFLSIVSVQCMLSVFVSWMLYQIVIYHTKNRKLAWFGMILYFLLVGLSPWVSITYSDSWAIFFPIMIIWVYYMPPLKARHFLRWFLILSLSYVGYKIKPQVMLVLFSIMFIEAANIISNSSIIRDDFFKKSILGGSVGLLLSFVTIGIVLIVVPISHKREARFGAAHFLMLGLNQNSIGTYNDADVMFARQYETRKERDKAELKEAGRRIKDMGVKGFGKLLCEKTLLNYYDGTFFWGNEGYFYKVIFPEPNKRLSPFLRNLYYNRDVKGKYYPLWCTFATIVWFGVLVLMFFASIGKQNKFTLVLMTAIILLTIYEAFFEAGARYLYSYIPFFILLALQGINNCEKLIIQSSIFGGILSTGGESGSAQ